MVKKGTKIDPSFPVFINKEGKKTEISFSELLDKPTVVSVYMKNNTSVCDVQAAQLGEHSAAIQKRGVNLLTVSKDTCGSHKKYAEKLGLDFTLVSDPDKNFAAATDSLVEKSMYGKKFQAPTRSVYIIEADGKVVDYIEKIDAPNHGAEIIELLEKNGY